MDGQKKNIAIANEKRKK